MGSCTATKAVKVAPPLALRESRRSSIVPSQLAAQFHNPFNKCYRLGRKLGCSKGLETLGVYGEVYECFSRQGNVGRTVKIYRRAAIGGQDCDDLVTRVNSLQFLDHPHVARSYETFYDDKYCYIVTE